VKPGESSNCQDELGEAAQRAKGPAAKTEKVQIARLNTSESRQKLKEPARETGERFQDCQDSTGEARQPAKGTRRRSRRRFKLPRSEPVKPQ